MEVSAASHASSLPGLRGPSPLLRLQSDERLIALTRRGQHAAFETLCARYESRLLAFCRHMLNSREDAEDVLQEVFTAAFNAVLSDEREINVRPWLYRIARNRSLNHLRRASAIGVDSMDVHFADHGLSTGDRVIRREGFRQLLDDVQQLPETQRSALLLREIDSLSYEQIAHAMETTVPSVKSLLVRARISLAEAAEARKLSCEEVRLELGQVAEGLVKLSPPARRHTRDCERCRSFRKHLKANNHALAAVLPVGPLVIFKKLARTGQARLHRLRGGAHVAAAPAPPSAPAERRRQRRRRGRGRRGRRLHRRRGRAGHEGRRRPGRGRDRHRRRRRRGSLRPAPPASTGAAPAPLSHASEPIVVREEPQAPSPAAHTIALTARHSSVPPTPKTTVTAPSTSAASKAPVAPAPPAAPKPTDPKATGAQGSQVTQVTSQTTQLPSSTSAPPAEAPEPTTGPPSPTAPEPAATETSSAAPAPPAERLQLPPSKLPQRRPRSGSETEAATPPPAGPTGQNGSGSRAKPARPAAPELSRASAISALRPAGRSTPLQSASACSRTARSAA